MKGKQDKRPSKEALRLLKLLDREGAYALPDPTAPAGLIVRAARAGLSVGGGRFEAAAGDPLVPRDLARWGRGCARERLVITPAGRAHLRRGAARPDEPAFF